MFRRKWSGLPKDVTFPQDLAGLGYFVNEDDEIRSLTDKDNYFKYFISRNDRVNHRQRFSFNNALEDIIHDRLQVEGLNKIRLPLGASPKEPHIPIFATSGLSSTSHVTIVLGETNKQLGLVAGRVANGPGGINKGSMVSVVRALTQVGSEASPRAVVLANTGETYWWPDECRAITVRASADIPLTSMAKFGRKYDPDVNEIPQNRNAEQHAAYLFQQVLPQIIGPEAKVDILAIGDSCEIVQRLLDQECNWAAWKDRLSAMVLLEPFCPPSALKNEGLKDFLAKRCRAYVISSEPVDTPLASPLGNVGLCIPALGCPVFSSSETLYVETVLITALSSVVDYLRTAASDPGYENPPVCTVQSKEANSKSGPFQALTNVEPPGGVHDNFEDLGENEKPSVSVASPSVMEEQLRQLRKWDEWEETGEAPMSDGEGKEA